MIILQNVNCCGIREMSGLSQAGTPENALKDFCASVYRSGAYVGGCVYGIGMYSNTPEVIRSIKTFRPRFRYAIFSQAGARAKYGVNFAKFIEENQLGKVVRADEKFHKNPNSGNLLTAWIWTLDEKAIDAWLQKKKSSGVASGAEVTAAVNPVV